MCPSGCAQLSPGPASSVYNDITTYPIFWGPGGTAWSSLSFGSNWKRTSTCGDFEFSTDGDFIPGGPGGAMKLATSAHPVSAWLPFDTSGLDLSTAEILIWGIFGYSDYNPSFPYYSRPGVWFGPQYAGSSGAPTSNGGRRWFGPWGGGVDGMGHPCGAGTADCSYLIQTCVDGSGCLFLTDPNFGETFPVGPSIDQTGGGIGVGIHLKPTATFGVYDICYNCMIIPYNTQCVYTEANVPLKIEGTMSVGFLALGPIGGTRATYINNFLVGHS